MDKIEKIRAEIARLKGQLIRGACAAQIEMETNCKDEAYNEVLAFIDTLEEEPDKDLEEEVKNYFQGYWPGTETAEQCNTDLHFTPPAILRLAHHFAKWGVEHAKKDETPVPNDLEEAAGEYAEKHGFRVPYDGSDNFYDDIDMKASKEGFIAGAKWQAEKDKDTIELAEEHAYFAGAVNEREQMMKEAVEGEVIVPIYKGDDTWSSEIKIPGRYEIGDKVRIIVLPKEDEK